MVQLFRILFITVLTSSCLILNQASASLIQTKDFFLVSIPKSGTHLAVKLLKMLTNRECESLVGNLAAISQMTDREFARMMLNCKLHRCFVYHHTIPNGIGDQLMRFGLTHPAYVKILQIRDLRDAVVSYIYHMRDAIIHEMDVEDPSFDEMLTHVLNQMTPVSHSWEEIVKSAIEWQTYSDVIILRFEDLVGSEGGGSDQQQKETILALASNLNIKLSRKDLMQITDNLFGNERGPTVAPTFRKGQIGSWKEHFKSHHIQLFNENWGHYQIELGYPVE